MELFLRYFVFTWFLLGVCHCQLENLRPLKGVPNQLDDPRNTTTTTEKPEEFQQSGNGGFGGGSGGFSGSFGSSFVGGGQSIDNSQQPLGGFGVSQVQASPIFPARPSFQQPEQQAADRPEPPRVFFSSPLPAAPPSDDLIQQMIQDGVKISSQQQQAQRDRPASSDLEQSAKFLSAFRRAEKEAEEASCVGRALIETTRLQAESLAQELNLPLDEAVKRLTDMKIDERMCEEILKTEDCEDFKKPEPCSATDEYRRVDGSCNNLNHPTWGRASTRFVRFLHPVYENGIDSMRGEMANRSSRLPSPRTVSFNLQSIRENPPLPHITLMVMQYGQFLDHDITFTAETQIKKVKRRRTSIMSRLQSNTPGEAEACPLGSGGDPDIVPLECCPNGQPVDAAEIIDCRPIDVSSDPLFKSENRICMRFVRSLIASRGCVLGPREQLNQLTSYIDASVVYGSNDVVARVLREGKGGHLQKTEEGNLLPRNCCEDQTFNCFKAGDTRVNEQPGLTSVHTLWLRVHEQLVMDFAIENPHWEDETLYQEARRVVIACIQQTIYRDFLPIVLGPEEMAAKDLHLLPNGPGVTYDPEEDASIANVIATAAFRFGHTLVSDILRAAEGEQVPLVGNFENAKVLFQNSTRPSAILEGLAAAYSQAPDFHLVLTLTNKLFADPEHKIGLDLMSLNIQRGRDHGLPSYNAWRTACGLPSFNSFEDLSNAMPQEVAQIFKATYSNVEDIDLFPAALSEFLVPEGLVGPSFACLLSEQFSRLKRGDRFFFQNLMQPKPFTEEQLISISQISLGSMICQHSDIQSLQKNVFLTTDVNGNEKRPCSSHPRINTKLWKEIPVEKTKQCMGVGPFRRWDIMDHWCTINCFHLPSFCPPTHCHCPSLSYHTG